MIPRVILMHIVYSSHFESHSGGSTELPSKGSLGEIFQKSFFYKHFSSLHGPPRQGPPAVGPSRAPVYAGLAGWLAGLA